jgi:hypothetical protein
LPGTGCRHRPAPAACPLPPLAGSWTAHGARRFGGGKGLVRAVSTPGPGAHKATVSPPDAAWQGCTPSSHCECCNSGGYTPICSWTTTVPLCQRNALLALHQPRPTRLAQPPARARRRTWAPGFYPARLRLVDGAAGLHPCGLFQGRGRGRCRQLL